MSKISKFFRETYIEMKHVAWPSRKRAVIYAIIVIVFSVALGYMLGAFDLFFKYVLNNTIY
jgi:preprotein translocase SecE subunit